MSLEHDQKLIASMSKQTVEELLEYIEDKEQMFGKDFALSLTHNLLACYIGAILYLTLTKKLPGITDKEQLYKHTMTNFADMKTKIQDAVAAGFKGAMSTYSGIDCEYYCQIKVMAEAVNKQPC